MAGRLPGRRAAGQARLDRAPHREANQALDTATDQGALAKAEHHTATGYRTGPQA
jgi:hypothetical protein